MALTQKRYTWRHDNVLIGIHKHLLGIVRKTNRLNASRRGAPSRSVPFVREGSSKPKAKKKIQSILEANN